MRGRRALGTFYKRAKWHATGPVRRLIEPRLIVRHWQRQGRPVPPPPQVKRNELRRYARDHRLRTVVETGTYLGEMTAAIAKHVDRVITIELSPELAARARARFTNVANVTVLEGDSGKLLPSVLEELSEAALFWLDGHYSEGVTARGDEETPIRAELNAILRHEVRSHTLLIDDAREFVGGAYPSLAEVEEMVCALAPDYDMEVRDDIIRITPKRDR
jgi:hypothetical protein